MTFDTELYRILAGVMTAGIFSGFVAGFISWGLGYAVYSVIKFFKQS